MVRNWLIVLLVVSCASLGFSQQLVRVTSPNGKIAIEVATGNPSRPGLRYSVFYAGKSVIKDSALGLEIQGQPTLGPTLKQIAARAGQENEKYSVPSGKSNPIVNNYNFAEVEFMADPGDRKLNLEVRAYDDGIAFRYVLPKQMWLTNARIKRELTQFSLAKDAVTFPLVLPGFVSSYEEEYQRRTLSGLPPKWLIALPLLAEIPGTAWIAISEANIDNYAGMYLRHEDGLTLSAQLAPRLDDQDVTVVSSTPIVTPWRVIMIGAEPGRLLESNILMNLNPPSAIADTSWIRPGKTMWDWWSGWAAKGVSFTPGMNTQTMKHYIEFASDSGFPYMLVDEGWAKWVGDGKPSDITSTSENIDMAELLRYAKEKNVRLWLWSHWTSVDEQMDVAFPLFEKWGIAGVKIDFMDRDDQQMVAFYRRVLKKAAEHHLLIDFHGAFKPDGIERTYPNLLTREGVMGLEYSKWSARITPVHNCALAFTRALAGPMDYTPGGFMNVTREEFQPRMTEPMVMGTRAHQLALYVVFQSGFQMASDFPERYKGDKDFEFIKNVPVTWDETRVLAGSPMEFISIARRSGSEWFVGSITDWNRRIVEVPLSFLEAGEYEAYIYADASDAAKQPTHTSHETRRVTRDTILSLQLSAGGGSAIQIRPIRK